MYFLAVKGRIEKDRLYYDGHNLKISEGTWLNNQLCYFLIYRDDDGRYVVVSCVAVEDENEVE